MVRNNNRSLASRVLALFGLAGCLASLSAAVPARAEKLASAFDGRSLKGWEGNPAYWSVKDGMIIGRLASAKWSTYLVTKKRYRNFRVGHEKEWNEVEILAIGDRVRVAVNGTLCIDFTDPEPWRLVRGPIGLQLHSGGPAEIAFKDLRISADPEDRMLTVR